jgi:hypothetical protein
MGKIGKYFGVDIHSVKSEYFNFILSIIDERLATYQREYWNGKRTNEEIIKLSDKRRRFIIKYFDKHPELRAFSDSTCLD